MKNLNFIHISRKAARLPKVLAVRFVRRTYQKMYNTGDYSYTAFDKLHYMINTELKKKDRNWETLFYSSSRTNLGNSYNGAYYSYHVEDWNLEFIINGDYHHRHTICFFNEAESDYDEDEEEETIRKIMEQDLANDIRLELGELS
jgi:hypothetical protein